LSHVIPFLSAEEYGPKATPSLPDDFVTAQDGTACLCTRRFAFGERTFRLGEEQAQRREPRAPGGPYDDRIGPYAGRFVKELTRTSSRT